MKYIVYLFVIQLITSSCKKNEGIKTPLPNKVNQNLNYFGFSLIDVGFDDPTDKESKTNYLDEVSDFSNLADILVVEPTDNLSDRIQKMTDVNVKPMFHLNEVFFEEKSKGGDRSGVIYGLRNDYQERWNTFMTTNNLVSNATNIGCLYIGEEPYWNGIPKDEFKQACDYAKLTLPQVPILNVEAYLVVDSIFTPTSVDWLSFDHYFLSSPSTNIDYLTEYNTVKSRLKSNQKMFLIMDAHWLKLFHGSAGISKKDMDVVARDYYNFANSDTTVVGLLGYFWPSGFDFKNSVGARNLPTEVKNEYVRIGKEITGK
jgi:hypothetical protein